MKEVRCCLSHAQFVDGPLSITNFGTITVLVVDMNGVKKEDIFIKMFKDVMRRSPFFSLYFGECTSLIKP